MTSSRTSSRAALTVKDDLRSEFSLDTFDDRRFLLMSGKAVRRRRAALNPPQAPVAGSVVAAPHRGLREHS